MRQSYTGKSTIKVVGKRYLKIPKLGYIKTSKTSLLKNSKIKRYTLSLEPNGKYYLALQVEVPELKQLPKTNQAVGIDLGVADLSILSDGTKFPSFGPFSLMERSFLHLMVAILKRKLKFGRESMLNVNIRPKF